jgi:hypothetical protein
MIPHWKTFHKSLGGIGLSPKGKMPFYREQLPYSLACFLLLTFFVDYESN